MEWAHRSNVRVQAMHNRSANALIGKPGAAYDWQHYSRAGQFAQDGMAMIQNTGIMGSGSFTDLMFNTQRGIASMGGRLNTSGMSMNHMGGGATNDELSRMTFDNLSNKFFAGGKGTTMQNMGRDPTEVSRAFMHLSNQGAFAGMSLGEFGEKSLEQRISSGVSNLRNQGKSKEANRLEEVLGADDKESALGQLKGVAGSQGFSALKQQITNIENTSHGFDDASVKEAGDAISEKIKDLFRITDSLEDVYGKMSEQDVSRISTRLTGISSAGNLKESAAIIEGMKSTADSMGVSHQEYLNHVNMSADMFTSVGMGVHGGSLLARETAASSVRLSREHMATAGIRTKDGHYTPQRTKEEIAGQNAQDAAGMAMETQTRLAAEMQYRTQTDKSLAGDQGYQELIDNLMMAKTPEEISSALAAAHSENAARGLSAPIDLNDETLKEAMSGSAAGVTFAKLQNAQIQRVTKGRNMDLVMGQVTGETAAFGHLAGGDGRKLVDNMFNIFDGADRESLIGMISGGETEKLEKFLGANEFYLQKGGTSKEEMLGLVAGASASAGGDGNLGNALGAFQGRAALTPELANMDNVKGLYNQEAASAAWDMGKTEAGGLDRRKKTGLLDKIMRGVMGGEQADINTDDVFNFLEAAGGKFDFSLKKEDNTSVSLSKDARNILGKDEKFLAALGVNGEEGLDQWLAENPTNNITQLKKALESSGYNARSSVTDPDSINVLGAGSAEAAADKVRAHGLKEVAANAGANAGALESATSAKATPEQRAAGKKHMEDSLKTRYSKSSAGRHNMKTDLIDGLLRGQTQSLINIGAADEAGLLDEGTHGGHTRSKAFSSVAKDHATLINRKLQDEGGVVGDDKNANLDKLYQLLLKKTEKEDAEGGKDGGMVTYNNAVFHNTEIHPV